MDTNDSLTETISPDGTVKLTLCWSRSTSTQCHNVHQRL